MITAQQVKELREMTGAGMMDCKKALVETDGNMDEAVKWLREKGISKAAKKSTRIAAEGVCAFKIKGNNAVTFEVNSETDFVAKNPKFIELVDQIGTALVESGAKNDEEAETVPTENVSEQQSAYTAPDVSFADEHGETVSLGSLKGKVVFINFWATWCGPCNGKHHYSHRWLRRQCCCWFLS